MRGKRVARKAGWDTHGLAVEIEVEKRLGLAGKKDIEQLVPGDPRASIERFNRACFDSVMTYERQWRAMTERVGYWVDLDDAYFTYSNRYIESVWWSLKTLHEKNLLFEGHKSQPYCARCGTTLSSHEVAQNYKDVEDPSIWVLFPARPGQPPEDDRRQGARRPDRLLPGRLDDDALDDAGTRGHRRPPGARLSRRRASDPPRRPGALRRRDRSTDPLRDRGSRASAQKRDLRDQPALARFTGAALHGMRYDRPYRTSPEDARNPSDAFAEPASDDAGWIVVAADYVTATDGTGLVHTAPAFGADDYATGQKYGLPLFQTIEPSGKVAERAGLERFAGLWFKDADREIVRDLKERGLLLHTERHKHSYPFCWRCDTPLLQYASKSWFVRTTAIRDRLVAKNSTIDWHPPAIGKARFGNWLEGVVDWALTALALLGHSAPDLEVRRLSRRTGRRRVVRRPLRTGRNSACRAPAESVRPPAVRPPSALHRRHHVALLCVQWGHLPARPRRHRRLVRLGRDAFRSAPLPLRERGEGRTRRPFPAGRFHLRGDRPDARLVLHPARPRLRPLRFGGVRALHRHGPRQRRPGTQDVEAPRQRGRSDGRHRRDRCRRDALVLLRQRSGAGCRASRRSSCARPRRGCSSRSGTRSPSSRSTPISTAGTRARSAPIPHRERADLDRWILRRLDERSTRRHSAARRLPDCGAGARASRPSSTT